MDWHKVATRMADDGKNSGEITRALHNMGFFKDEDYYTCYERVRKYVRKHSAKKNPVCQNLTPSEHKVPWNGTTKIKFAVVSDTHICGKYTQLTYLNEFYDLCAKEGITDVYHCGDICDGDEMRVGHSNELYKHGVDEQTQHIIDVYPFRKGITTHFITGNHDASVYKHCGCDIGKIISSYRNDMDYLGRDFARVHLTDNCVMEMRHPWDGSAYAISTKPQKMIDGMLEEEKPNLLFTGHYHKSEYLFYKGVHAFHAGCFQGRTPFERGKNILSTMGGWIIELEVGQDGVIRSISPKFIPYYHDLKDDYKKFV